MDEDWTLGWGGDAVGKFLRLQTAVRLLAEGKGKHSQRLEKSTYPLAVLLERDFPERLRKRASTVLALRAEYVFHVGDQSYFREVPPSVRRRFVKDLLALYEACLIDLGRRWPEMDFMYPKSEPERPSTRLGKTKLKD